jgi:hypothetical protein
MEDEPYSDQLIRALQQLRARVIEVRSQHNEQVPVANRTELVRMHGDIRKIRQAWSNSRVPTPPPYGASIAEVTDYNRRARHVTMQDAELMGADVAIDVDFSVEAIDNAIRVAESQA